MNSVIIVWENEGECPESLLKSIKLYNWLGPVKSDELKDLPDLPKIVFYKAPSFKIDWWQWFRAASVFTHVELALWVLNRDFPLINLNHEGRISDAGVFGSHVRDGFFPTGIVYTKDRVSEKLTKFFLPAMETKRDPSPESNYKGALLLDRDGIINEDRGYVFREQDLKWEELGVQLIALAKKNKYEVHILTNQSGVGRGYYREEEVQILHLQMNDHLASRGLSIDSWSYCPFHPKGVDAYGRLTQMRKPGPGMLLELLSNHLIDPQNMLMVGDKASDRLNFKSLPVILIKKQYDIPENIIAKVCTTNDEVLLKVENFFKNRVLGP